MPFAAQLAPKVAEFLVQCANEAVRARGFFTLGVSGGNTPLALFALLAQSEWVQRLPWAQMCVFWVDERWVPYSHTNSNFGQFSSRFLDRAGQLPVRCYPMPVQGMSPASDAQAYADELALFFGSQTAPVFDCFLLGLGSDGHTASLFPHSPLLECQEKWVAALDSPPAGVDPALPRLSLTLPVLNAARNVAFLVSGAQKADVTKAVLQSVPSPRLPATLVRPQGALYWFVAEISVPYGCC
ncbi:MAG: 6-phosphogluconolactonase [Thermodesulfobacteriota bacterium]